jgi:hypothetical protein
MTNTCLIVSIRFFYRVTFEFSMTEELMGQSRIVNSPL